MGTFRRHFDYGMSDSTSQDVGQGSEAIALGDLNGDRRADVVEARFDEVSVFVNAPGMCTVPDVYGTRLAAARRRLAERHCSVGKVKRTKDATPGLVWQQRPSVGTVLPKGGKVNALRRERHDEATSPHPEPGRTGGSRRRAPVFARRRLRSSAAASNADGAIVFASTRDGNSDLWAVKADGTGLTQLTNEPFDAYNPLPSPDGRHILFEGGEGMTVMDVDGSGRRAFPSCSVSPEAWSSDSRHVVCSDDEAGILVVDTVDGTSRRWQTRDRRRAGLRTGRRSRSSTSTSCT